MRAFGLAPTRTAAKTTAALVATIAATAAATLAFSGAAPVANTAHAAAPAASGAVAGPNIAAQKAALGKLAWLEGRWEGAGWTILPNGERATFRQTEDVALRLGGAILVIEGRGYPTTGAMTPDTLLFNAFGVVSFDDQRGAYAFRSYAMGYASTFSASLRDDGAFEWRIAPPGAPQMRYVITQPEPGVWFEIGERSSDGGATWTQFFEMRLTKKTD